MNTHTAPAVTMAIKITVYYGLKKQNMLGTMSHPMLRYVSVAPCGADDHIMASKLAEPRRGTKLNKVPTYGEQAKGRGTWAVLGGGKQAKFRYLKSFHSPPLCKSGGVISPPGFGREWARV